MNTSTCQTGLSAGPTEPTWIAGAAEIDVTPDRPLFLFGYPHVERYSQGVHDPLLASALYLSDGRGGVVFIGCDVIFIPKPLAQRARARITETIGISGDRVMITATHTHSGPITQTMVSNEADPAVPPPDTEFLRELEDGIVRAAIDAFRSAAPAALAFATTDGAGLGTNRRDPRGPSIPTVPVLTARRLADGSPIGVMCVVSMHPTVLHEDWHLISGDFPGLARQWLRTNVLGRGCPFVYHMGASGDQSPRHVVRGNTIEEANRLGEMLGRAVAEAIERGQPVDLSLDVRRATNRLPLRRMPSIAEALARVERAKARLATLRESGAERARVRTAECDWFGAEETLTLAKASASGRVRDAAEACLPAEVQVVRIGEHAFVGWPGEVFVEFALRIRREAPNAHIITLANGELQGYLVTQQAVDEGGYEAANALFASPDSGDILVDTTLRLLGAGEHAHSEPTACPTS